MPNGEDACNIRNISEKPSASSILRDEFVFIFKRLNIKMNVAEQGGQSHLFVVVVQINSCVHLLFVECWSLMCEL